MKTLYENSWVVQVLRVSACESSSIDGPSVWIISSTSRFIELDRRGGKKCNSSRMGKNAMKYFLWGHDMAVAHKNSKWLWLIEEDLHRSSQLKFQDESRWLLEWKESLFLRWEAHALAVNLIPMCTQAAITGLNELHMRGEGGLTIEVSPCYNTVHSFFLFLASQAIFCTFTILSHFHWNFI